MQVINAAVVSRGEQNEQTLTLGRRFLAENRLSVMTVFKRSMNIGVNGAISSDGLIDDLAESYMLLITLTGFINVSGTQENGKSNLVLTIELVRGSRRFKATFHGIYIETKSLTLLELLDIKSIA